MSEYDAKILEIHKWDHRYRFQAEWNPSAWRGYVGFQLSERVERSVSTEAKDQASLSGTLRGHDPEVTRIEINLGLDELDSLIAFLQTVRASAEVKK